jgi:hypothetical protein
MRDHYRTFRGMVQQRPETSAGWCGQQVVSSRVVSRVVSRVLCRVMRMYFGSGGQVLGRREPIEPWMLGTVDHMHKSPHSCRPMKGSWGCAMLLCKHSDVQTPSETEHTNRAGMHKCVLSSCKCCSKLHVSHKSHMSHTPAVKGVGASPSSGSGTLQDSSSSTPCQSLRYVYTPMHHGHTTMVLVT